jgi:tetratricopeptide (TPR) repeat protein
LQSIGFTPIPNREACNVLVGYGYQVDLTIHRWLQLGDSEVLLLECGEDIDALMHGGDDHPEGIIRRLEQVKVHSNRVTLRTPGIAAFLANSVYHETVNKDLALRFLFTTTARVGKERPSYMPGGIPGLQAWEQIRTGQVSAEVLTDWLAGIRATLESQGRPDHLSDKAWKEYRSFITKSSPGDLRAFILQTEWGTGGPEPRALPERTVGELLQSGYCVSEEHARQMYDCLFVHVFRTLTKEPPRCLAREDIAQFAKVPDVGALGQLVLELVQSARVQERRVDLIEARLTSVVSGLESAVGRGWAVDLQGMQVPGPARLFSCTPPRVAPALKRSYSALGVNERPPRGTWLNVHGSSGTGKTQLLIEISAELKEATRWASMRSVDSREAESSIRAILNALPSLTEQVGGQLCIVIDDLPTSGLPSGLVDAIAGLADTICEMGVLLTCSYTPLPDSILERIHRATVIDVAAPPFTTAEAAALMRQYGAPETLLGENEVELIVGATHGHPVLIAGLARMLAAGGWAQREGDLGKLLSELGTGSLGDQLSAGFLREVEDGNARELLYRLALVTGDFSDAQVAVVADGVEPRIPRARELLLTSIGLWVERRSPTMLSVSPLLVPVARRLLTKKTQVETYLALAMDMTSRSLQGVPDVLKLFGYYVNGDQPQKAVWLLGEAIDQAISADEVSLRLLEAIAESSAVSGLSVPIELELYLLTKQLHARRHRGEENAALVDKAERLFSRTGPTESWMAVFVALNVLPIERGSGFPFGVRLVEKALGHLDDAAAIIPAAPELDVAELGAVLLWSLVGSVHAPEEFATWIGVLETCREDVRGAFFGFPHAAMGLSATMDELARSPESSVRTVLEETLRHILQTPQRAGFETLRGCAARCLFILLSRSAERSREALALAADLLEGGVLLPEGAYAVRDAVGRYFVDIGDKEQGLAYLTSAISLQTDAYPSSRWGAAILVAAMTYEMRGRVDCAALEYALSAANEYQGFCPPHADIRAMGELGIASWLNGEFEQAYKWLEKAMRGLLGQETRTDDWKATFVLAAHALGYIAPSIAVGTAPKTLAGGESFVAPTQGHFLNSHPELPTLFRADRVPAIVYLLSLLAGAVGDTETSGALALEALEQAREMGIPEVIAVSGRASRAPLLASNSLAAAIDAAIESALMIAVRKALDKSKYPILEPVRNLSQVVSELPYTVRQDAELQGIADGVIPTFLRALSSQAAGSDQAQALLGEIAGTCDAVARRAAHPRAWEMASAIVRAALRNDSSLEELLALARKAKEQGAECLSALAYFGIAATANASLRDVAVSQALASHYVYLRTADDEFLLGATLVEFLETFWRQALERQAFRFTVPAIAKRAFEKASQEKIGARAQAILVAALTHVKARLPEEARDVRNWLGS